MFIAVNMNRTKKILIGVGVLAIAFTVYKVIQKKTISEPTITKKLKR
jgi:hypothetical protein